MSRPFPAAEAARLAALYQYEILDTPVEREFDDFTRLAAHICGTPVALISFVDRDRQWFKSVLGLEIRETPVGHSICKHVVDGKEPLIIPDTSLDPRFCENPLVSGDPHLRFYAGAPLETPAGEALGSLCVLDFQPREITAEQRDALTTLARKVMDTMELRSSRKVLHDTITSITDAFLILDDELRIIHLNDEAKRLFDPACKPDELIGNPCTFEGDGLFLEKIREAATRRDLSFEYLHPASNRHLSVRVYPARNGVTVSCRDITERRETGKQLRLLKASVANIGDMVVITEAAPIDLPGPRIVYVNDAFVRHSGYDREEIIGQTPRILQGPKTQREALDRIRAALAAGRPVREELINYTKSGEEFWLELEIAPVAGENNGVGHLVCVQRVVSERKRIEAERRRLMDDLDQRVRELGALHQVASLMRNDGHSAEILLENIAAIIPAAMRFPETAAAMVAFEDLAAATPDFESDARYSIEADFTTRCGTRGSVKVIYQDDRHASADDPFLDEERALIRSLAEMLRTHFERLRANASLLASEDRFRRTFQDAATGIAITDAEGRFLQTNAAFRRMLGYTEERLRELDARAITVAEDWPASERLVRQLLAGKRESFVIEKRYLHADGRVVWVRLSVSAIRSDDETQHMIGVAEDISERKRAEFSLAASEKRFRQLAESMPIVVWTATPEGEIDYVSPLFYEHCAASTAASIADTWREFIHPADRPLCLAAWQDSVATGELYDIEYRVRGGEDDDYRWFRVQARPIRDDSGKITRWFGTGIDIHQNRQLQEDASQLASSLTATLESITDAFITIDRNWVVTYLNREAERQLETSTDLLLGGDAKKDLARRAGPRFRRELRRAMTENVTITFEERFAELGKWFDIRIFPSVEGIAIYLRNITESKRSEIQLREQATLLDKAQDAIIVRDLDHRILYWNRSAERLYVLAPILMSIDLLKLTILDRSDREVLSSIETSARRGAEMIGQVLAFARGSDGPRVEVDLRHLVNDIIKISRDTFPKNIHLDKHLAGDLWLLRADPTQLHQVLLNLCVNSRDAMPKGGTITIRTSNVMLDSHYSAMNVDANAGPHVLLEVEDQGGGIPQELIEKIFDPFFTTKEVGAGTGLGLSTTLGIVKSHEGFIRVCSEPGAGTRFMIHLPAGPDSSPTVPTEIGKSTKHGKGETVLLVEDDSAVRQVTHRTLETFGYQVLTASDGAEGFSTFVKNQNDVDLILTDIMMPVMDGLAMVKALRRIEPEIKVVAASGIASHGETIKASHPEIARFLAKPYSADRLLESLREVLDR